MADPLTGRDEIEAALELASREAVAFLAGVDQDPVQPPGTADALARLRRELPEDGEGTLAPLRELGELGREAGNRSAGPRFFHL